jgi:hypothetical protein
MNLLAAPRLLVLWRPQLQFPSLSNLRIKESIDENATHKAGTKHVKNISTISDRNISQFSLYPHCDPKMRRLHRSISRVNVVQIDHLQLTMK